MILGWGRSPGEGKGYPLQYFSLQNSMDCTVHGVAKSRTRLRNFHFHWSNVLVMPTMNPQQRDLGSKCPVVSKRVSSQNSFISGITGNSKNSYCMGQNLGKSILRLSTSKSPVETFKRCVKPQNHRDRTVQIKNLTSFISNCGHAVLVCLSCEHWVGD